MMQQGMISDADGDIAALVYAAGDRPDQVLLILPAMCRTAAGGYAG